MGYTTSRDGTVSVKSLIGGMNNKLNPVDLPEGFVRNIVNADISDNGKARLRKGMTKIYSSLGVKYGHKRYFIENLDLCYLEPDNTKTVIFSGVLGTEFTFCDYLGVTYFSDGIVNKKLVNKDVQPWGLPVPAKPVITSISGTYFAGTYLAAYSWVTDDGVESGLSDISTITLATPGGFMFVGIPNVVEGAKALRIYLSTANGNTLYFVAEVNSNSFSMSSGSYDSGHTAEVMFKYAPPPASIIRFYNGRAYVADAYGVVWYSEPFSYDHFGVDNYLQFPERVAIMEPVKGGIYFATGSETFFYAGNPETGFDITKKFNYGAIRGTGKQIPNTENVTWMSKRGLIVGNKSGSCENVQEKNVAIESGETGELVIREQDGLHQVISIVKNSTTSSLAATSFIEAEVIRRSNEN